MASQMEDPFELIPVDDIVSTYERDINRWDGGRQAVCPLGMSSLPRSRQVFQMWKKSGQRCPVKREACTMLRCLSELGAIRAATAAGRARTDHRKLSKHGADPASCYDRSAGMIAVNGAAEDPSRPLLELTRQTAAF